ncbi:SET domain-containing protein-lysine N-methyltransferase [Noviherbaspirillum cavernae]|uniref:SET domain-containing protein-lysine N-methyltransferase n=1 Tax=Noviherbaspirillum cavernae TaxID=2320862 RepID=A0A418WWX8_9BURK|nr:SET domain-containing protein-lysine N-methyltransferase [Noviherbaspirillum cavernae]RJG04734.1 SET domain-containing protein-lysine N-methyltransferase [Noviherbaspirillum cavernae]
MTPSDRTPPATAETAPDATPNAAPNATPHAPSGKPLYSVRDSRIHGRGVFAARKIAAGTQIIEYEGERVSWKEADRRHNASNPDSTHTFFFSLESGRVIDGGSQGNDARWINHACAPNCEAREENKRIFIYALRDIKRGEELNYDYGLVLDERHTAKLKRSYQCLCGAATCRGTMLAPKKR